MIYDLWNENALNALPVGNSMHRHVSCPSSPAPTTHMQYSASDHLVGLVNGECRHGPHRVNPNRTEKKVLNLTNIVFAACAIKNNLQSMPSRLLSLRKVPDTLTSHPVPSMFCFPRRGSSRGEVKRWKKNYSCELPNVCSSAHGVT